jgi:gamma-glutamyl hercynylcysteine S-oxide synthase
VSAERTRAVRWPLMTLISGETLGHAEGFIPRLAAYTHEDKAAKGLRSLKERGGRQDPPIHFSVLEVLQDSRCVLFTAPSGGGKTALARHLWLNLGGGGREPAYGPQRLTAQLARNDCGDVMEDRWRLGPTMPVLVRAAAGLSFADAARGGGEGILNAASALLIIDEVERLGRGWDAFAGEIVAALEAHPGLRVLLLGSASPVDAWSVPDGIIRHHLLPLLLSQRRNFEAELLSPRGLALPEAALGAEAAHPALFALAPRLASPALTQEAIVDGWVKTVTPAEMRRASRCRFVSGLLWARRLAGEPPGNGARVFRRHPRRSAAVIASLLCRLAGEPDQLAMLAGLLIGSKGDAGLRGALLAADALPALKELAPAVMSALLRIVEGERLTIAERAAAGRAMAAHGDPRDLEALALVPSGRVVMGSATHPNSMPIHVVDVTTFRIGVYPVVNAAYKVFAEATGRPWPSLDGFRPDRANAPAVDLTWHDANAYCAWLTQRWRNEQQIGADEIVRLPTEVEWEWAARGVQPDNADAAVYPWGVDWSDDRANAEPAGFNDTVPVGLFPGSASPFGCRDMAGQVWEWCSTLWGEEMASPSFAYPWRDDGREAAGAPDAVRRVLRGGCFSSPAWKACVTYRGSLEANGFWRGNGFRIVVGRRIAGSVAKQPFDRKARG